ncbi:MAG: 5-formyltetrahydrofolate cyclo-ligase [Thaumarchaeota archaeon]|nr:5-formyltetrahydrofolate cyclo-ligase [Nitrososphaerota archaeon]
MRSMGSMGGGNAKKALREAALRTRRSMDREEIKLLSGRVQEKLRSLGEFERAKVLASYVSTKDEVQTDEVISTSLRLGKRVLVPIVDQTRTELLFSELRDLSELGEGHYGIREPRSEFLRIVPLEEAGLILVPLVAWDERGFRIGHGKGYFDKALGQLKNDIPTTGLAFEAQRVDRVPNEEFDVPLGTIVTEQRVLRFRGRETA